MKKIVLSTLFIMFSVLAFAQGKFKFNEELHDFGTIKEGDVVAFEFVFTNEGTTPIIIQDVRPSCGCTTPEWTKTPIPPKGKGTIKASFNSQGRPGAFNKTITVISNATEASKILTIKGTAVTDPDRQPKLTLDKKTFNVGKVQVNQEVTYKIPFKNLGKVDLNVYDVYSPCQCVRLAGSMPAIKPNSSGILEIVFKPTQVGIQKNKVFIRNNSQIEGNVEIVLEADVVKTLTNQSILRENTGNPFGGE